MTNQKEWNFQRIADAIAFINMHYKQQPSLDDIAKHVHLSPTHFQKLFTEWAGISPKRFMQFLRLEYAKNLLREKQMTLFDVATEANFSSTSRLHDLFIGIVAMTPAEYKNGGASLQIQYSEAESPFGKMLIASTDKGICHLVFLEENEDILLSLKKQFPNALLVQEANEIHAEVIQFFSTLHANKPLSLHLKGTDFQLKVWAALLKIPSGELTSYGKLAQELEHPKASRAVGTAIGNNPIAFLIPCHRVIQASGALGGYRWGLIRKQAMIGWEGSRKS